MPGCFNFALLQPRSPTPAATRLARVWAPPTPIQPRFADRGWSRSEFSDFLWVELKFGVGVGVVYGQKRPILLKLLIDHRLEIEISYFVLLFY